MKFPYGNSDFEKIVIENYFYVDRTDRIPLLEEVGDTILFLRPRRFGKSLWLSTLENYYDVAKADRFEELFGRLAIGQNPTVRHNQYLILKWNFSLVDPSGKIEEIRKSLHDHLNSGIYACTRFYRDLLPEDIEIDRNNAIFSFEALLTAVNATSYKIYLLIDEYDNFANEVLMAGRSSGEKRYKTLIEGEGMLKTVFKAIKGGTEGRGIDRLFITGVSPVVMSDMTSGFNIAEDISLLPEFHDLCGFWESEVTEVLSRIAEHCTFSPEETREAIAMMRTFYNGYRFSSRNELTIKTIFLAFLFNDLFYIMDSETALQREYADMTMIIRPDMRQFQLLDFLFEFKYIGLKQHGLTGEHVRAMSLEQLKTLAPVKAKLTESNTKLEGYRQTLKSVYGDKLRLHVYSVVAIGYDRLVWKAIDEYEE